MKILVLASYYPNDGHPFSGPFNERSVIALQNLCEYVEVLVTRPYTPRFLSWLNPRWQAYTKIAHYEIRNGITVYRPAYLQLPKVGAAFWRDRGAFLCCKQIARERHRRIGFNAIVSFDIFGVGSLAWRLGLDLGIPASGWACGSDLAKPPGTFSERVVIRALKRLDLVFYQSHELFDVAAELLGLLPNQMQQNKHIVLARGIPEPPKLFKTQVRHKIRSTLGIRDNQIVVMNFGRVVREKGVFDLLEAISLAAQKNPNIVCVIIGSNPAFDETAAMQEQLYANPDLQERVKFLPACRPDQTWEYLCAADIFAFPSHQRYEGMPNSLQEAMVMEIPAIAFAIRPVLELEAGTGALLHVPQYDTTQFAEAIVHLADSPEERSRMGNIARNHILEHFMAHKNMMRAYQQLLQMVADHSTTKKSRVIEGCDRTITKSAVRR